MWIRYRRGWNSATKWSCVACRPRECRRRECTGCRAASRYSTTQRCWCPARAIYWSDRRALRTPVITRAWQRTLRPNGQRRPHKSPSTVGQFLFCIDTYFGLKEICVVALMLTIRKRNLSADRKSSQMILNVLMIGWIHYKCYCEYI